MTYSEEYTAYITGDSGNEHQILIEVEYNVDREGGIGAYEFWGHMEYDEGKLAPCDAQVVGAWLVRHDDQYREIDTDSWVAEAALERFIENWEWTGE